MDRLAYAPATPRLSRFSHNSHVSPTVLQQSTSVQSANLSSAENSDKDSALSNSHRTLSCKLQGLSGDREQIIGKLCLLCPRPQKDYTRLLRCVHKPSQGITKLLKMTVYSGSSRDIRLFSARRAAQRHVHFYAPDSVEEREHRLLRVRGRLVSRAATRSFRQASAQIADQAHTGALQQQQWTGVSPEQAPNRAHTTIHVVDTIQHSPPAALAPSSAPLSYQVHWNANTPGNLQSSLEGCEKVTASCNGPQSYASQRDLDGQRRLSAQPTTSSPLPLQQQQQQSPGTAWQVPNHESILQDVPSERQTKEDKADACSAAAAGQSVLLQQTWPGLQQGYQNTVEPATGSEHAQESQARAQLIRHPDHMQQARRPAREDKATSPDASFPMAFGIQSGPPTHAVLRYSDQINQKRGRSDRQQRGESLGQDTGSDAAACPPSHVEKELHQAIHSCLADTVCCQPSGSRGGRGSWAGSERAPRMAARSERLVHIPQNMLGLQGEEPVQVAALALKHTTTAETGETDALWNRQLNKSGTTGMKTPTTAGISHEPRVRPKSVRSAVISMPLPPQRSHSSGPTYSRPQAMPVSPAVLKPVKLRRRKDWDSSPLCTREALVGGRKGSELAAFKFSSRKGSLVADLSRRIQPAYTNVLPDCWPPWDSSLPRSQERPPPMRAGQGVPCCPHPLSFTDLTKCSRSEKFVKDVLCGDSRMLPAVTCGALEVGLVRSSARALEQVKSGGNARASEAPSLLDAADLSRCRKAAALLLARQGAEKPVRSARASATDKRISAARRRRFQAEVMDIQQVLMNVKTLTSEVAAD